MELDFDKEIDALLRQSARDGEAAPPGGNRQPAAPDFHLGADELSAFADNALPEKIRRNYVLHLADCETCRKKLSSLIALNSEAEIQTIQGKEKEIIAPLVPWYRAFFAVPKLAYALGTLVLLFSGIAVYMVLQNDAISRNADVSQVSERQPNGKGMSSDGDALPAESYSSSAAANTAMSANSNTAASSNSIGANSTMGNSSAFAVPAAPETTANSNTATKREEDKKSPVDVKSPAAKNESADAATQDSVSPANPAVKESEYSTDSEAQKQQPSQNTTAQNQTQIMPDARSVQGAPKPAPQTEPKSKKSLNARRDASDESVETTSSGGKTFKRENNVWYDSTYRGQATINIVRGTSEYKKLDSGLRGIAENLGGTVVVVWKGKAYRIQ